MTEFNVILVVGITALVIVRQFSTRPVRPRAYIWIVLLIARGLVPPGPARVTAAGVGVLAVSLLVSMAFGALRGRSMRLWRAAGDVVLRRGGPRTLLLWLATVATRLAIGAVAYVLFHEPFELNALWLGFGVTLGAQHLVVARRARDLPPLDVPAAHDSLTRGSR